VRFTTPSRARRHASAPESIQVAVVHLKSRVSLTVHKI
jgi:hypothetical protein